MTMRAWGIARVVDASLKGRPYFPSLRVPDLAKGAGDADFSRQLQLVALDCPLRRMMPPHVRAVTMRAVAFQGVSRMGCAFERLVASRHRASPIM